LFKRVSGFADHPWTNRGTNEQADEKRQRFWRERASDLTPMATIIWMDGCRRLVEVEIPSLFHAS
jgi:hypothetical protein